jgi:DNA ligase (NAD+)
VTPQARRAAGLPATLSEPVTLEVRGEVFMTETDFQTANELRVASGGEPFANPRSGAAGSLRAQNRVYEVPLSFLAYAAHGLPPGSHAGAMAYLDRLGVATTAQSAAGMPVCHDLDELITAVETLSATRAGLGFEVDGAVIKADSAADREAAGSSSRAPRWGIAYKYPAAVRTTKLLAIDLQVGRTGVITPVAVLEPVQVGGVTVRSATLHNFADLILRDVHVGDTVFVRRAGEVIPEIVGAKLDDRAAGSQPFTPPEVCPHCGAGIDRSQKRWRCTRGRACQAAESLSYAVSRDALDIDGLGDTLIEALVAGGRVVDLADLFDLDVAGLAAMERMGDTSATKLVTNIQAAKQQTLARVLTALGVRMTGRSMSRRLAAHFGSLAALQASSVEQLQGVDGVGPERAVTIAAEMRELTPLIARLADRGVRLADEAAEHAGLQPLRRADGTPMTVVVTGSVPGLSRTEGNESVEALGGRSSSSVSKKTDLVVAGDGAGSKADKAVQLKVPVLPADRFAALLAAARAADPATCDAILAEAGLAG